MTEYSKFNFVYRLQKWIDSVPGQTFLNYAYSWGASIVILGTLFKLTHLPGANFMLYVGMGTEVFVFFISAFDRPFDKTADGMDLPSHLKPKENAEAVEGEEEDEEETEAQKNGNVVGGGTIIIGGGASQTAACTGGVQVPEGVQLQGGDGPVVIGGGLETAQAQTAVTDMQGATTEYIDELKNLTEMLKKVTEQSSRLTRDSEEMENLNRTLTGICKVYEMQLKSASSQIGTIDSINEQSRKMADQINELNNIYARMIQAMTVNMRAANPNAGGNVQQ